jgi:uncharacterized protein YggE
VPTGYPTPFGAGTNGGFTLSFVGTLSDTRRKAALETAMARARQRAAELAELAGGGRGNLCYLASDISSDINRGMPTVVYYTPNQAYFQSQDPSNVVGQSPDLPELTVQVTLNYHLVPKNP